MKKFEDLDYYYLKNKQFFSSYYGKDIKNDLDLYNEILKANVIDKKNMFYICFDNDLKEDCFQYIYGIRKDFTYFRNFYKRVYIVDLIDSEIYFKVNNSLFGKIRIIETFEINKNGILKLLEKVNFNAKNNLFIEKYAVDMLNKSLFKEVFEKYKNIGNCNIEEYYNPYIEDLKKILYYRFCFIDDCKKDIKVISNLKDLFSFMDNKKVYFERKISFENKFKTSLLKKNDNLSMNFQNNDISGYLKFFLYDFNDYKFNSSLPYYFQFINYKNATIILYNSFKELVDDLDDERMSKKCDFDFQYYGLYFPLLMNFRQSIELFFKLIIINNIFKKHDKIQPSLVSESLKQNFKRGSNFKVDDDLKVLNTHNLLYLLSFIEEQINHKDFFNFLNRLCCFIISLENSDPSFSRYILNQNLDFKDFFSIDFYYHDLCNYILAFYKNVDYFLEDFDLGFDIDNVFILK